MKEKDTAVKMEMDRLNKDKTDIFTKLSRTLYIGNLNENISYTTLHKYFEEFGDIISISIKQKNYISDFSLRIYASIQYFDPSSVVLAMLKMNAVIMEDCHISLGFGKSHPSKCVLVTGLKGLIQNNFILSYLADCGPIISCSIDHINERALIYFKEISDAEIAINKMKNGYLNGLNCFGDYASFDCEQKFSETFNKQKRKNYLSTDLDNVHCQYLSISDEKNSSAANYVGVDSSYILPTCKEHKSPITCVWINGIADSVTNEYLESYFSQFGPIKKCLIDQWNRCALLCFQQESHAQTAVYVMNGSFIKGQSVYVHLSSIMCQACEESNINNNDLTIVQPGYAAQSLSSSTHVVPYQNFKATLPSCSYNINDETYPTNISDPYNNSINVNNAQYISQHKDFNTSYINISNDSSNTNSVNNCSISIANNQHLPEISKSPTKYANSVISLPLPKFSKNITSPSLKYSLSSNSGVNQPSYMYNLCHDEEMNCGLDKTDKQNQKYDQNSNHPQKLNFKILESANSIESVVERNAFIEGTKRLKNVSNKYTLNKSSTTFQNQKVCLSLKNTISTSGSSKSYLKPSTAVNKTQYYLPNDTQPIIIPQNSKAQLIDTQFLPFDPMMLINSKRSSTSHTMISDSNALFLEKQNICTINDSMHTNGALNNLFTNPIKDYPEDKDRNEEYFKIVGKIRHEYTKQWVNTGCHWLTNKSKNDCVEKFDCLELSDTKIKDNKGKFEVEQINKQNVLDGFMAESSTKPVDPISIKVKKSTNIDTDMMDHRVHEKSIAKVVLSLNKNKQSKNSSTETKNKIKTTNFNNSASNTSNNVNNIKNKWKKSVHCHHTTNKYKDHKYKSISSIRSRRYKSYNIKPNKTQRDDVEKTNFNEYKNKHININKSEQHTWNSNKNYYSTKSSLKRSISNTNVNHYNSKRYKTDNKTYKNNCTKILESHSPKSRGNIHNTWMPEKKNMNSKINKTPNESKVTIYKKMKTRYTNNMKKKREWKLQEKYSYRKKRFES
ncbi:putative uncharacterized protein DDB_G0282133 [Melanaphis sacchari]|nr:putative uncharacterized protein DDB_G0282133 [Melanaphis sacchari]